MNSFPGLNLHGEYFTQDRILNYSKDLDSGQFTAQDHRTLSFCSLWLSGAGEFEIRTSGSTGKPKTIRLHRSQMALSARMTAEALGLDQGNRALVCLSPDYIGGLMMLVRGLVLNLELDIVKPRSDPFESFAQTSAKKAIGLKPYDFYSFVPLQLRTVLSSSPELIARLNKAKAILVGGAEISPALLQQIQQIIAPVYQTFGMTETASHIALRKLNGGNASEEYHTLPGVELGQDHRGCLTIQSKLTMGERIVTNDVVILVDHRGFKWLGRVDHVINTGGLKVQPERVEQAIAEVIHEGKAFRDADRHFFVAGIPDATYGQSVALILEGEPSPKLGLAVLDQALLGKIEKHEIPRKIIFAAEFVRTKSGKINRGESLQRSGIPGKTGVDGQLSTKTVDANALLKL